MKNDSLLGVLQNRWVDKPIPSVYVRYHSAMFRGMMFTAEPTLASSRIAHRAALLPLLLRPSVQKPR
jgi:hypothetical protein